jgi:8-oxo-dGTP diphosphatase
MAGQFNGEHLATVRTAGGLVWRIKNGTLQVQMVHRPRYDDWSWPKGKLEHGETHQAAAAREVTEETHNAVILQSPLPGTRYQLATGQWKTVTYWMARRASRQDNDLGPLMARDVVKPASAEEIDTVRWIDAQAASAKLTRRADRKPLEALMDAHNAGILDTRVVVIARHGTALARGQWHDGEGTRPLTPIGHAHAAAIVPVLAAYGVARVVSSRWERCAATVEPYVRAANVRPWFSDNLTELSHERSPERVAATVTQLLESSTPSVLCTHRPVLPTVFATMKEFSTEVVADVLPKKNPYLRPGELVVAHVATVDGRPLVVSVERVAPELY